MSHEFEDRQNDGIGELPTDISRERGDLDPYLLKQQHEARLDVLYQQRIRDAEIETGTAPYGGDSIAHYDSRPINAKDWDFTGLDTYVDNGAVGDTLNTTTFTVPAGFIGVIRGWRYQMIPTISIAIDAFLVSLLIDGQAPINYFQLFKGQAIADFIPTFLLVRSGGTVGLGFLATAAIGTGGETRTLHSEFVGNLLQDTGAPLEQEISNRRLQTLVSQKPGNVRRIRRRPGPRQPNPWGPLRRF